MFAHCIFSVNCVFYMFLQYFDTGWLLGLMTCKHRRPYNLYCVGGDVKPCSINQVNTSLVLKVLSMNVLSGSTHCAHLCMHFRFLSLHNILKRQRFNQSNPCLWADKRKSLATNSRQSADRHYQAIGADRTQRSSSG